MIVQINTDKNIEGYSRMNDFFSGEIKKELQSLNLKKELTPVIRIINKNLTTGSDWKMFQEAFNNIDTDFLKKLKDLHFIG